MARHARHSAGRLRIPVTIQQHDGTKNNRGQLDQAAANWDAIGTGWMSLAMLGGGELERARMHVADATHTAELRYQSDVVLTPLHRLKRRDTNAILHIGRVHDWDAKHAKWLLTLVEVQSGTADV